MSQALFGTVYTVGVLLNLAPNFLEPAFFWDLVFRQTRPWQRMGKTGNRR